MCHFVVVHAVHRNRAVLAPSIRALQDTSEKNETTSSYTFTYSREPLEKAGLTTEDQVVVPVRIAHVGVRVQLEKLITRDAARSVRANLMADGTWSGSGLG